jgi:hypothetical protein
MTILNVRTELKKVQYSQQSAYLDANFSSLTIVQSQANLLNRTILANPLIYSHGTKLPFDYHHTKLKEKPQRQLAHY